MGTRRAPPSAGLHTSSQPSSSPLSPRCSASCSCRDARHGDSRQGTAQRPALPSPRQRTRNASWLSMGDGKGAAWGFPGAGGLLRGPGKAREYLGQLHPEPVAVAQFLAGSTHAGAAPQLNAVSRSAEGPGARTRGGARGTHPQPQALRLPHRQQHARRTRRVLVKLVEHLAWHEGQRRRQRPSSAEALRCLCQEAHAAQQLARRL